MALRNIVKVGDEILNKTCKPVEEVNDKIRQLLDDMVETMRAAEGVGLAAPQVGVLKRIFVAEPEENKVYYFINPKIIETSGVQDGTEGCLSVPEHLGLVSRPKKVKIEALDYDGNLQTYEFEDLGARIMCHENDHLDGVIYTDRATRVYTYDELEEMAEEGEE